MLMGERLRPRLSAVDGVARAAQFAHSADSRVVGWARERGNTEGPRPAADAVGTPDATGRSARACAAAARQRLDAARADRPDDRVDAAAAGREVAPGLTFADTTTRVVAFIIDSIILFFGITIIAAILGLVAATTVTDTSVSSRVGGPIGSIVYALLGLAYFVGSWTGGRRATIGQRVMNIQVGNAFDGRALSLEQAVRRWLGLGAWIGILGVVPSLVSLSGLIELLWVVILLITTATSPTKQGLHDRFAHTALVRPTGQGTSGLAMACIVIVIVLLLLAVISFVALIFLGGQVSDILSRVGDSI